MGVWLINHPAELPRAGRSAMPASTAIAEVFAP
jgi:hypothetical protein